MRKIFSFISIILLLLVMLIPVSVTVDAASGSAASIHMNGGTGYIFNMVFNRPPSTAELIIVVPGNGTVPAVYPNGQILDIGDQLIYVLVTDSTGAPIGTILPNTIGHRGTGSALEADGSMGTNGNMTGNNGTINFWFNGFATTPPPSLTNSYLVANKVWLNSDGSLFTGTPPDLNFQLTGTSPSGSVNIPMIPGVPVLVQDGNYTITEPDIQGWQLIRIDSGNMTPNPPGRQASVTATNHSNYSVTFTNEIGSTSLVITGIKTFDPATPPPAIPGAETFGFVITTFPEGKVVATATNDAAGNIVFTPIIYTLNDVGKTFNYRIREVSSIDPNWAIDTKQIPLTVTVTLSGTTVTATPPPAPTEIEFTNTAVPITTVTASFTPQALKQVSGVGGATDWIKPADGQFSFSVIDITNPSTPTVVSTGKNDADGDIIFTPITYTEDDTYPRTFTYRIDEITPLGGGWSQTPFLPDASRTFTVNVDFSRADPNQAEVVYPSSFPPIPGITIRNVYIESGFLTLSAHKLTNGNALTAGQFQFSAVDEAGNSYTATNDASGNIIFPSIRFDNLSSFLGAGFHTLTITETPSAPPWTASAISYTVLVRVVDNGNGTMTARPFNINTDNFVFINTYQAAGDLVLNATKRVSTGAPALTPGQFEFAVVDENGNIVATGTNDIAGVASPITFTPIHYTLGDVGLHHYTVFETSSGGNRWTPSSIVYHVSVTVIDNGNGTITATPIYPRTGLVFINTYDSRGSLSLTATKNVIGGGATGGEFRFEVIEEIDGNDVTVATGTNSANGQITFSAIPYTSADIGTHNYKVVETTPSSAMWQTDSTVFNVSVKVEPDTNPANPGGLIITETYPSGGMFFVNRNLLTPVPPAYHPAVTVIKEFHGLTESEIPKNLIITITGPEGFNKSFNLSEVMSASGGMITNLVPGTYTISEQNDTVASYTNKVSINAQPVTLPYSFQISQSSGHITFTVANTYTKNEKSPQTGISSNLLLPSLAMSLSVLCFVSIYIHSKYKKKTGR